MITPIQQEISKPELLLSRQEKYLDQIFELINLMTKSPKIGSGNRIYRMLSDLGYPNIADFGEWSYSDGTGSWRGYDTSKPYWRDAARWVTDTHADNARNVASNNLLLDSKRVQLAQIELTRQHELQKLTEQYGQPFINLKHTYDDMLARLPRLSPERSKYSEIRNWQKSNAGKYFLLKRSYPKESLEGVGKARFGLDFRVDGLDPINTTLDEESALFLSRWVQSHATEIDWWKIAMQHSTIPEKKPYFDPLISTTHNLSSTDQFGDTTMYIKVPAEKIVPYSIVAREQINYLERELSSIEWQNEDRRNSDEYRDLSLALQKLRTTIADEEFMVIGHINMDEITSVTSDCSVCSIEARKIAEAGGAAIRNQDTQAARHAINLANNHTYNRPDLQHMVNAFAYASMGIASNQKLYFNLSLQELAYARAQFDNYEQSGQLIGGDATIDPSSLDLSGVEPRLSNLLLSLPENGSIAALNPDQVRNNLQQAQDYISELGGNTRNINWLNPIVLRELAQNRAARLFGDANNVFGGNQENNDNSEDETVVPTEATEFTGTATTVVPQMDQGSPGKNNAISVNQTIKLPVGEVTITKELGSGGFGTTYLAKRLSDNFQFVIKVAKNNPKAIQTTIDEYAYLREINETLEFNGEVSQSSIVSAIIDIDDDPNIPYGYILEYAGGTSLKDLVKAGKQLTPGQYKNLYQLARTLDKYELYLSDIYITNILLDRSFPIVIDPLPKKLRDQLLSEDPNQMIGHGDKFRIPLRLNNTQMLDKLFERFPSLIPGSNQTLLDFSPKPIKNPFQQIVNTSTQIGITMNIEGINMFYDFGKKLAQSLKSIKISEKGQVGIPLPALFTKPDELKFNFPDNTNQLTIIRPGDNEDSFSNKYLLVGNRVMQLSNLKYFDLPQFLAELPNDTNVTTNLGDRYTISDGELLKASATITARVVDTTPFSIVASEIPEIDVTLQFSKDAPEYYGATYSLIAEQYFPEINLIRGYPMLSEKLAGSLSPGEIVLVYGGYKEMFSENMPSEEDVDLANNILQELGLEGHSITSNTGNINAETSNTINIMIFGLWPQYYEDRYLHMPWTSTFGKNTIDVETAGKYFKGYAAIFDPHVEKPLGVIPDLNTTMAPSEHLIYIVPNEKIKATILIGLEKSPFIKKEASQKLSDRIFTLKDVIDGKLEKYINK